MLKLTRENWWTKIAECNFSIKAVAILRVAVSAYLRKVIPPQVTEHKFHEIVREVGLVQLGDEMLIPRFIILRYRLTRIDQSIILPELRGNEVVTLLDGSRCRIRIISNNGNRVVLQLLPTSNSELRTDVFERTFPKNNNGHVELSPDIVMVTRPD